jgi:FkbM family methyltransferase
MKQIHGLFWPDETRDSQWRHSLKHVRSVEWAIAHCAKRRTAVQAGGNMGLWPRRLAESFARVITFEPDAISRACLMRNVPSSVEVRAEALGRVPGWCAMAHSSLGSHHVEDGRAVEVTTIDLLGLADLDFLQLDIEGYEWHALAGAVVTIQACRPLIQIELRDFGDRYGKRDEDVRILLDSLGYREVSQQPGNDVVFEVAA